MSTRHTYTAPRGEAGTVQAGDSRLEAVRTWDGTIWVRISDWWARAWSPETYATFTAN